MEASLSSDADELKNVISTLADGVVDEMKQRWKMVAADEERAADEPEAERYVDKVSRKRNEVHVEDHMIRCVCSSMVSRPHHNSCRCFF